MICSRRICLASGRRAHPCGEPCFDLGLHGIFARMLKPIEGVVSKGSHGTILEWRIDENSESSGLPVLTTAALFQIEVDFIPSQTHQRTKPRFVLTKNGREHHGEETIGKGVEAGKKHTVGWQYCPGLDIGVGQVELRMELKGDGIIEVCGTLPAIVK